METAWKMDSESPNDIEGFKSLKNVVLDFNFFQLDHQTNKSQERTQTCFTINFKDQEKPETITGTFANPALTILSQLQQNCKSLQDISLFLCISQIEQNLERQKKEFPRIMRFAKQIKLNFLVDTILSFDKIKRFELCAQNNLDIISLQKVLASKNLEFFGLKFCCFVKDTDDECSLTKGLRFLRGISKLEPPHIEWDSYFAYDSPVNQLKGFRLNIPTIVKTSLSGRNFVNYLQKLDFLQTVELVDENCKSITLDLLYGILSRILEKKTMKKVIVITNVVNEVYSAKNRAMFSQAINTQIQKVENLIFGNLEKRIACLKEIDLEEIMIGKFRGYETADFIFYNKDIKNVSQKVFWTEKEINELYVVDKNFARLYERYLELFKEKEKEKND